MVPSINKRNDQIAAHPALTDLNTELKPCASQFIPELFALVISSMSTLLNQICYETPRPIRVRRRRTLPVPHTGELHSRKKHSNEMRSLKGVDITRLR